MSMFGVTMIVTSMAIDVELFGLPSPPPPPPPCVAVVFTSSMYVSVWSHHDYHK